MIYDISMTIHPRMPVYKNREEKRPRFKTTKTFEKDGVYETDLTLNLHTGTHIDFPLHTLKNGQDSHQHDVQRLLGEAKVFDLTHVTEGITENDLIEHPIEDNDFILFKTKNSARDDFDFNFVYLTKSGAEYLVKKRIRGVGIDALGIERNQPNHPTHDLLLSNNILILEGIRLKNVPQGNYEMMALPMPIDGVEALPVRALLKSKD